MYNGQRQMRQLTRGQALRNLGSVGVGRIVFTERALPAVRPANHILDNGQVIISSRDGAAIVDLTRRDHATVVAYEADQIDPATHTGWTVTITGFAHLVNDPQQAARHRRALRPWITGEMNHIIRIDPQIITGYEQTADTPAKTT
jgi:Pyridoxamine 5'-phosphate oxidase